MNRRHFIALGGLALGGLGFLVSPLSPLPWRLFARLPGRSQWLEDRMRASLASLLGRGAEAAPMILRSARGAVAQGTTAPSSDAVGGLTEGLSRSGVRVILSEPSALRAHLGNLHRNDLLRGHSRWVDGWLLSETEIAIATVLAGGRPS